MIQILTQALVSLVMGVIAGLIVYFFTRKPIISLAAFLGIVFGAACIILIYTSDSPPYQFREVQWKIDKSGLIYVSGTLLDKRTDSPVAGQAVQIKIFEAGENFPFKGPKFPTTNINGNFTVEFSPPPPKSDTLYIINTAYRYGDNKWEKKDFDVAFIPASVQTFEQDVSIIISEPQSGQKVSLREWVRGKISDTSYELYVLIHPVATDNWWVQPLPNVRSGGNWEAYCFFGEETAGIGESFEIIAIGTRARNMFRRGQRLPLGGIPRDALVSSVITVIRR